MTNSEVQIYKEISVVPMPYNPNGLYFIRVGAGVDIYVANSTGTAVFKQNRVTAWIDLVSITEYVSEVSITGGSVLTYNMNSTLIYRYITTAENARGYPVEDAFYSAFDGTTLSNKLAERKL